MKTHLSDCVFQWDVTPASRDQQSTADVIIALAFGYREFDSGLSNRAMARVVERLFSEHGIPIIAQHEITDVLRHSPLSNVKEHRTKGEYLDTFEVLFQAYEVCKKHDLGRSIIVAHPHHQWRAMKTATKLGLNCFAAEVASVPYDPKSEQWWTRNAELFTPYEFLARLTYLRQGKI